MWDIVGHEPILIGVFFFCLILEFDLVKFYLDKWSNSINFQAQNLVHSSVVLSSNEQDHDFTG